MKNEDNAIPFTSIHSPSNLNIKNEGNEDKKVDEIEDKEEKTVEIENKEKSEKLKLTISDKEFLGKFIDLTYLDDGSIEKINNQFCDDSSVQLKNFLKKSLADKISEVTKLADVNDELGTAFKMCYPS